MELTFEIKITVGDNTDWDTQLFVFDYEPSQEEYEEFAKNCGFNNGLEMVIACSGFDTNNEDDQEDIEVIQDSYERENCSIYLEHDKHQYRLFQEFLVEKYQKLVECWILHMLTINSDWDLNQIIRYS